MVGAEEPLGGSLKVAGREKAEGAARPLPSSGLGSQVSLARLRAVGEETESNPSGSRPHGQSKAQSAGVARRRPRGRARPASRNLPAAQPVSPAAALPPFPPPPGALGCRRRGRGGAVFLARASEGNPFPGRRPRHFGRGRAGPPRHSHPCSPLPRSRSRRGCGKDGSAAFPLCFSGFLVGGGREPPPFSQLPLPGGDPSFPPSFSSAVQSLRTLNDQISDFIVHKAKALEEEEDGGHPQQAFLPGESSTLRRSMSLMTQLLMDAQVSPWTEEPADLLRGVCPVPPPHMRDPLTLLSPVLSE